MDTANPNASSDARRILNYINNLKTLEDTRVLIGQQAGYTIKTISSGYSDFVADLYTATSKYPAYIGTDYGDCTAQEISDGNDYLIDYWNMGGMVTISLHANNPWTGGDAWDLNDVDLEELITPGNAAYTAWMAELDKVATGLGQLQTENVVVLWRPLHEMNFPVGFGFWWCYQGSGPGSTEDIAKWIAVWQHMFDYFTTTKGLNNLLWVYSPANRDTWDPLEMLYPGDDYVDIVGVSCYNDACTIIGGGYAALDGLGKPILFGERGPSTLDGSYDNTATITSIQNNYPHIVGFLQWHSWVGNLLAIIDNANRQNLMDSTWGITMDELDWYVWPGNILFTDFFHSSDLSAWDSSAGTPVVSEASAMRGQYGMECNAAGDYVVDNFSTTSRLRVRFYFDPNSPTMSGGDGIRLFMAFDGISATSEVRFYYDGINYQIRASIHDGAAWNHTAYYNISDAKHYIEADWNFEDGTDGFVSLYIDGVLQETLGSLDTDARNPDNAQFGWVSTGSGAPSGTLYFDYYWANRDGSEIGQAPDPCIVMVAAVVLVVY